MTKIQIEVIYSAF